LDRSGGHVGLMADWNAKREIWSGLARWLRDRSDR
jgi:hypothetical protein